jgi:hypothetical protein
MLPLAACVTPMKLGISEAEWENYSPEQKQKIKKGYYYILKKSIKNTEKGESDGTSLHVQVSGGKVNMPPFSSLSSYVPITFDLRSGDCQTVHVMEQSGDKKVPMKVCYYNKTLYLDPSRYDPDKGIGSIQLHYSPIWDRGFTYQGVSSSGYVHLTNVNVTVKKYGHDD